MDNLSPCSPVPLSLLCSGEDKEAHPDEVQDAGVELGRPEAESDQRDCVQ